MPLFKIRDRVKSSALIQVFDLFHGGSITIAGREIRLEKPVLPLPVKVGDCIEWRFIEPVKVSTPGPDSRISVVKQWRDRIEIQVWPWADVVIGVVE